MTNPLTKPEMILQILKANPESFLTASELAEQICTRYEDYCQEKMKRNPRTNTPDLVQRQIAAEISAIKNLKQYGIQITADRPKKFYLDLDNQPIIQKKSDTQNDEFSLYPVLTKYCKSIGIDTLRINEKTSSKKGENQNHWLHADIVGFKDLTRSFSPETKECLIEYAGTRSFLYSFEVKRGSIKSSDLRKFFFQTVSNSSWANYSYLVAEGIENEAWEELQLLCASFQIGFIQVNRQNPNDSEIKIQAPKTELDWKMIDRIASVNEDFKTFLRNISLSYQKHKNSKIKDPEWDD